MTYRGDKPIINSNTPNVITERAFIKANLIMFQKIANVLSIVSFVMVTSIVGGSYFGYKYVTSEQFKAKIMNQVLGEVKGLLPNVMNNALPKTTGKSLPIPKKLGL